MKLSNSRQREILGILLFSFAVFSLISLYLDSTGWVGIHLRSWLEIAFGELAILFSIIILVIAVRLFRKSLWPINFRKLVGYCLLLICFGTVFHLITVYQGYQLPPSMKEELSFARNGVGGGVFNAFFMVLVLSAFGIPGSYIMLGGFTLIGLILVFNVSLINLLTNLFVGISKFVQECFYAVIDFFAEIKHKVAEMQERRALNRLESLGQEQSVVTPKQLQPKLQTKQAPRKERKPKKQLDAKEVSKAKSKERSKSQSKASSGSDDITVVIEQEPQQATEDADIVINPTPQKKYRLPPIYLLKKGSHASKRSGGEHQQKLLEDTFTSFGIDAKVVNISQGPVVSRYELQIGPGIKVSRITSLADDIALALAATDVRIEAPVPGKSVVGIEVPNDETQPVLLREVLEHPDSLNHTSKVALALGKDIAGNPVIGDLRKWLHLLIAGATGSGKSVCLNTIIISILFRATPEEVKLLLIDPKRVELSNYDGIPHLISPVVTDPKKAATALRWAVMEMERRYKILADNQVKNIDSYYQLLASQPVNPDQDEDENETKLEHLPYIVVVVDELADLMMVAANDVEEAICRLAQMARAAGIYLIIATQRPSVDVITGLIKANVPSRISFAVSSQVDSRTILDMGGAERLIGKGDMLYYPLGATKPNRAQGAFVTDKEVEAVVSFWKKQGEPEYQDEVVEEKTTVMANSPDTDELLDDAIKLVVETGQASISMLQRRFRIGYSRAARMIDMMEVRSIVGPYQGSRPREVLIDRDSLDL